MKITLPNGIVVESNETVTIDGITFDPTVQVTPEEADEILGVTEPTVEEAGATLPELFEETPTLFDDDLVEEGKVVRRLQKSDRYPTKVASLTKPLRDTFRVLAQYDNEGGVHSSHVARELNIGLSAANTRCWNLWKKHGVAEHTGKGKYRAILVNPA